jgi:hypothetical protein
MPDKFGVNVTDLRAKIKQRFQENRAIYLPQYFRFLIKRMYGDNLRCYFKVHSRYFFIEFKCYAQDLLDSEVVTKTSSMGPMALINFNDDAWKESAKDVTEIYSLTNPSYLYCYHCGSHDDLKFMRNGRITCPVHYRELDHFCDSCCNFVERLHPRWGMCESCVLNKTRTCIICGDVTVDFYQRDDENGDREFYCPVCFTARSEICNGCGARLFISDLREIEGILYCSPCRIRMERNILLDWNANVLLHFQAKGWRMPDTTEPLFGIELETQVQGINTMDQFKESVNCVRSLTKDFCILKRDGSIGSTGIEIVSIPMKVEEHVKCDKGRVDGPWENFLTKHPKNLYSWKGGACGMHIHISRKALSSLQIGKMIVFLNAPRNQSLITTIAGRYGSGFSKVKAEKTIKSLRAVEKYEMLNLMHPYTVEMRIFRGTLNRNHFYSNIQFAAALVQYVKVTAIRNICQETLIKFVEDRKKEYPFLFNWFIKKKLSNYVNEEGEI